MMTLPRLSGSLFGVHLRVWLLICVATVTTLTGYRYVSDLNGRLEVLVESKAKLGEWRKHLIISTVIPAYSTDILGYLPVL